MFRVALAALVLLPLGSRAGETVVRLKVSPMPEPRPALKYQLLPTPGELHPGNPVHNYLKCFAEQRSFFFSKEAIADRARYRTMPLAKLPADKLRDYGRNALWQADWAARLDTPDWQLLPRLQSDDVEVPLPELGCLHVLATALQVRFRGEVASRRFDAALHTAKTMFALARHLGEHPTEPAHLVALSVAHLTLDTLEEMLQQSGCPNLYWALTDLPCPLVDARKGVQGNRLLVEAELRLIRDDGPMSEEELEKVVSRLSGALAFAREQAGQPPRNLRAGLKARVQDTERLRAARGRLVGADDADPRGWAIPPLQTIRRVWPFSPLHVILLDEKRAYEIRRDDHLKLLSLAPWQIDALREKNATSTEAGLFADLVPDIAKIRRIQGLLEQRLALLQHVEAIRRFAAAQDDRLPATLADIAVPLPVDPFTGKPFDYEVEGRIAHLRGRPPRGEEKNQAYNVRYQVILQK